ncbi:MAG: DGQHR domain-containing protein [Deltaproteobacteria bacterium]|nr:DGQHR domain-containing protein [Deltaproteobacteria bacterium]
MTDRVVRRRALRLDQTTDHPLYLFSLTADELLSIADISRISRDDAGKLIGYQRPEVRHHVEDIVDYLNGPKVLFPNSIILALSSRVEFVRSRGPQVNDGLVAAGTLEIPMTTPKPAWIVDGQQRALALSRCTRRDLAIPVNAFVADEVDMQRDQFLRVNNTRPLPRGLITELLPEVSSPLPSRLAASRVPAALAERLAQEENSPFHRLLHRASSTREDKKTAVIADSSVVKMLQESLTSPSGCLFPFRNMATGETDFMSIWTIIVSYWSAVKKTFPGAWGLPPGQSRLMHGAGIRAMGRLMDRVVTSVDLRDKKLVDRFARELRIVEPYCRWTSGTWEELGLDWDEVQNVPRHIRLLSNYLVRCYLHSKGAAA